MLEPAINLVVALPPEARPINRHLGLVRDNHHDRYRLYRKGHISLVISGPGADSAARATEWLHSVNDYRLDDIWINLGIAGHPHHPLGEIFQASEIEDRERGHIWHLETKATIPCPSERVISVITPDTTYSTNALIEMEAAGFYRSATKQTTPDRIHCIKVVSDNRENPANMLNGKMVSQLIQEQLDMLDRLITTIDCDEG